VVFKGQKKAGLRIVLIVMLLAGVFGVIPARASAETFNALDASSQSDMASQGKDCSPGSGWMWTSGPSKPDVARQVQQELSRKGIQSSVEARGYGETDSCGTYRQQGVDFTITLMDAGLTSRSTQQGLADYVVPVLAEFGKPELGNVKLLSSTGERISVNLPGELSMAKVMDGATLPVDAITKNVYVVVYDPLLSSGQLLSQYMHWNDHALITQQTIDLFKRATNNRMNYVVVDTTIVTSGWPELIDGFSYTEEEYLAVWSGQQPGHKPEEVDYNKFVSIPELDICGRVNRGEIDEVWVYNAPYFGFYESRLVGPGAYKYNSPPIVNNNNCTRLIPIMGPSVERTSHEAVHNFNHRAEATMEKVYGSWAENRTNHRWDQFGLVKLQSPDYSYSGCGSAHWPPNAVSAEYDYDNPSGTLSNCGDFLNYPNLGDPLEVAQLVTCSNWGCNGLGYYEYWFNHFPAFSGCGADNIANDWWIYFANPANALSPSSFCPSNMYRISGNAGVPGVVLSYTDGIAKTTMADEAGNYSLVVSPNWSGTITPSKIGRTFSPASKSYTNVMGNLTGQDYTSQGGTPPTYYYVNIATGNNANACTSAAAPCRNIQEAINKASSGDVVYVATGRYLFSANGTPNVVIINRNITLSGGWNATFSSQVGASTIDGANANNGILILSGAVVVENFIVENSISSNSGAIYIVNGYLTLKKSTLRNNVASSNGAGIFVDNGTVIIINSTISGNRANGAGGGIYASLNSGTSVTIQNSTIAYNQASRGGGISRTNGTFNITNTIIGNNTGTTASPDCEGAIAAANFNIIENMAGCSITTGSNNLNVDPQIDNNLTGAMLVHMPLAGSPAINAGTTSGCPSTDQQGSARPYGSSCDIGSIEYLAVPNTPTATPTATQTPAKTNTPTATPASSSNSLYLSLMGNQTIGGVASADEDILRLDGMSWSLFFDGSDVGVGGSDLFGFSLLDPDSILMSFSSAVTVNGLAVTPQDVVRFDATSLGSNTAGTFSMYLDGSDVGLETTAEKIDSVSLLPDGRVLISTTGNPSVPGAVGKDEDVLAFTPTSLGDVTSGSWAMYFDGSDVGLAETSGEDVDALDVVGGKVYLSTADNFSVTGLAAADEDVFVCESISLGDVTACNYSPSLYFDGSTWGLSANDVDAFNFLSLGPAPTPTYTITPTSTPTVTKTPTPGSQFLPDLTITEMRNELQNTSCFTPGDPFGVRVWIKNIGQAAASSFVVNVNGAEQTVNGLGIGETKAVFFPGSGNPVTATVDSTGAVAESDETNNTRSEMLPIPTAPLPCATPTFTPTPTATIIPSITNTPGVTDLIFADGFESGNLSSWTASTTDLGDLSVSSATALVGSQGLQAVIDDNNSMYLTDDHPNAELRYRARFYFDPNSLAMTSGDAHYIFKGFMGTSTEILRMEFRSLSGAYQVRAALLNDGTSWVNSNWFAIGDATHFIELDWKAASAIGANNGSLTLWIDNIQQANLIGVDNDTWRIDRARLGALTGIDTGTRGTYYFDAFESRRQSYIGP
jgi:CARDB protein